jgi:hypothetical protein
MSEILSYPKGVKATFYMVVAGGEIWRRETNLVSFGTYEKYAQYENVPYVHCRAPKKRRQMSKVMGWQGERFLLAIEGWGHPDAPPFTNQKTTCAVHDRVGYRPYLARVREFLLEYSRQTGRKVLVDVHDAISLPHFMTEPERYGTIKAVEELWESYQSGEMSQDELRTVVASRVFTVDGEAQIMGGDPAFVEMLERAIMRQQEARSPQPEPVI